MGLFSKKEPKTEDEIKEMEIDSVLDNFCGKKNVCSDRLNYIAFQYAKISDTGQPVVSLTFLKTILKKEMLNNNLDENKLTNRIIQLLQLDYQKIYSLDDTSIFHTQDDVINYFGEKYNNRRFTNKQELIKKSHIKFEEKQKKLKNINIKNNYFDREIMRVVGGHYFRYKLAYFNIDEGYKKDIRKVLELEYNNNQLLIENIEDRAHELIPMKDNLVEPETNLSKQDDISFNSDEQLMENNEELMENNEELMENNEELMENDELDQNDIPPEEESNLIQISKISLIECPECNKTILNNVNYCRFCGHSFLTNKKSLFARKYRQGRTYCQNCGKKIVNLKIGYCDDCGTEIPSNLNSSNKTILSYEEYQIIYINKFIVPISEHYNTNFLEITLKDYFNLTKEQELRIIYVIMENLKKNDNEDIVKFFETTLNETRENFENLEEVLFHAVKQRLTEMFNSNGISVSEVATIKSSRYDTIETPVVQNKHGGLTKGAATLGFGLIGLAATSGVKTTTERKQVFRSGEYNHFQINFNNRGVVLKSYSSESSSKVFDSKQGIMNQIGIRYEDVHSFDSNNSTLFLESGETFNCPRFDLKYVVKGRIKKLTTTYDDEVNNQFLNDFTDKINDKVKSIVGELINEQITLAKGSKNNQQQTNIDINGLEKIVEMYEKGLLTDEEFAAMKQKFIGNDNNSPEITSENKAIFCGNCGAEIIEDSKFCIQCGSQIK